MFQAFFFKQSLALTKQRRHLICHKLVARCIEVNAIQGQYPPVIVCRVVPELELVKDVTQVNQPAMELCGNISNDLRIFVQVAVLLICIIILLSYGCRSTQDDSAVFCLKLFYDGHIEFFEFVGVCSRAVG